MKLWYWRRRYDCFMGRHWPKAAHGYIYCARCDLIWSPLRWEWHA